MTTSATGDLTLDVPPLRRDHKVHAWVAARGLSDLGDTVWLIALAWTAVHVAGPAQAGLLVGLGTLPRAALMLFGGVFACLLYTSPSPRDISGSRMPSSA